jgi:hypothetical protein
VCQNNARKRQWNQELWKRNQQKAKTYDKITVCVSLFYFKFINFLFIRYAAKSLPQYSTCKHYTKSYICRVLTMLDIRAFHSNFYKNQSTLEQDNFIIKCSQISMPIRCQNNKGGSGRKWSSKYFIKK